MQRRRQLVRVTKKYGLHVQPAALQAMLHYAANDANLESLDPILEQLQDKLARANPKIITPPLWEEAMQDATAAAVALSNKAAVASASSTAVKKVTTNSSVASSARMPPTAVKSKHPDWRIIDAFDTPALVYDSLRQQFHYDNHGSDRPALLGTVEDKIEMMSQRFLRVQQRVARTASYLTSIDRLLGTSATSSQTLLGLLHATSTSSALAQAEGAVAATGFELEDLTGSIPLHLHSGTHVDARGVYTDGCIVLVEGYYDNGIFVVSDLQMPPMESKAKSQPYLPPAPDTLSGTTRTTTTTTPQAMLAPLTIYTLANVNLEEPAVLQQLEDLVAHLSSDDMATKQTMLVLMGNFATSSLSLVVALEELSRILEPLPSSHSVVIMPGPNDTPSTCWPIPPIKAPPSFSNHLRAAVTFASNPCRLQYAAAAAGGGGQQDVLLFRQDMIRQHLQNEILSANTNTTSSPPSNTSKKSRKQVIGNRILHTVLSQGHLLPQAPIYWNYDYSLTVYPLPDLMLVGLEPGEEKVRSFWEDDCQVLSPGSHGNWAKVTLQPRGNKRRGTCASRRPLQFEFSQQEDNYSSDDEEISDADSMEED